MCYAPSWVPKSQRRYYMKLARVFSIAHANNVVRERVARLIAEADERGSRCLADANEALASMNRASNDRRQGRIQNVGDS